VVGRRTEIGEGGCTMPRILPEGSVKAAISGVRHVARAISCTEAVGVARR
jgi:hypothetical protein